VIWENVRERRVGDWEEGGCVERKEERFVCAEYFSIIF
jgi:hypothetical protein